MTPQSIKKLTNILLGFVGLTLIYFLISTIIDGYFIWGTNKIDFAVTGQVGDFIGGFLGTIINGAAFYFLYLTLNEQRKSSEKQSFETKLFELIHLHRENVSELRYTKNSHEAESRKVFRVIAKEFIECLHEVQRFSKMYNDIEAINPVYRASLERIRQSNGFSASVEELAAIDLAYNFLYFGSSHESDTVILHKFFRRYKKEYGHRLRFFMQLKPKQDNKILFDAWESFKEKDVKEMKLEFDSLYKNRARLKSAEFQNNELAKCVFSVPYYNGHQHRLGHYFRHLFQSFKFISLQNSLSADEKYFYAKSIRSQLSMYEQLILLVNSISSLGMNWEYTSENKASESTNSHNDFKFITRYNLVKNLLGSQYYGITYRNFYPRVNYEYFDDIAYHEPNRKRRNN